MSFASVSEAIKDAEVTALKLKYARSMAKKYLRLERLNDPIIHRYGMYDYMKLHGVAHNLITAIIDEEISDATQ